MEESERSKLEKETSRARSLGSRSRSQGRSGLGPNELLARKQQLLGEQSGNWTTLDDNVHLRASHDELGGLNANHRRSQIRRAKQLEAASVFESSSKANSNSSSNSNSNSNQNSTREIDKDEGVAAIGALEAKLESLSEQLRSHQQQATDTNNVEAGGSKSIESVYILLAKKEKDLQLAAELGKVLLEKNDQLSKANERITEDYSHKLELLEQDKHKLKRKLDQLDGEYENRLIELQADCNILKNQLEEQKQFSKQKEKEKSKLIDDLVQQNQRLTSELVEATKSEELLSSQLEQMNERFNVRFSNRQDHVAQLDALKEEIQIVNQRKQDLERRLKQANSDKGNLQALLEEGGDKVLLLENLLNEKDGKLNELLEEISELRDSSSWLSSELESMISLNERLTSSLADNDDDHHLKEVARNNNFQMVHKKRSQLLEQLKELRLKKQSRLKASEFIILNRAESNNIQSSSNQRRFNENKFDKHRTRKVNGNYSRKDGSLFDELNGGISSSSPTNSSSSPDQDGETDEEQLINQRLRFNSNLLIEIYSQLNRFQMNMQARKDGLQSGNTLLNQQHLYSPNSTDDSGISADDMDKAEYGELLSDPNSWRRLLDSLKSLIEEMPCSTCHLMIAERADYEQLQKRHSKLCDEFKRKEDELLRITSTNLEQETKLTALQERCDILSDDLKNCDMPKEEIIKLAWKARDEAVERKNMAEISLAKTRIENMQISSQLMEVVQQKGELSQKLAQFEDDIHYITQHSVKAKFTWEEYAEKLRRANSNANTSLNPLAQLLNFSSTVVASATAAGNNNNNYYYNNTTTSTNNSSNNDSSTQNGIKLTDSQPANLMRNFTSNRFNLRFWRKNSNASNEKQQDSLADNHLNHKTTDDSVNNVPTVATQ